MNQRKYKYDTARIGEYLARAESNCFAYVNYWVGNEAVAEDICQDACLALLRYMASHPLGSEEEYQKLMNRIVRCRVLNYFKKASTKYEILSESDDIELAAAERPPDSDWMRDLLYEQIRSLKDSEKYLVYSHLCGVSSEEVGRYLGKSAHAVDCAYSRIVSKLKKQIKKSKKKDRK